MDLALEIKIAGNYGICQETGESWFELYQKHLVKVKKPLTIVEFRLKTEQLNLLLLNRSLLPHQVASLDNLSKELGL